MTTEHSEREYETSSEPSLSSASAPGSSSHSSAARRRGRPLEMAPDAVLDAIRALAAAPGGLFRVHRSNPALYARARRLFGTWGEAVRRAGVDYAGAIENARQRSLRARRAVARARND